MRLLEWFRRFRISRALHVLETAEGNGYCIGCGNFTGTRKGRCDTCGAPKPNDFRERIQRTREPSEYFSDFM